MQCIRVMWRKEGAISSLLLMTVIVLIESCMLYVSIIMCVGELEESPNLQLFSFTTTHISIDHLHNDVTLRRRSHDITSR